MYAITGASGQLGRLVLDQLLKRVPANQIIALARKPESLAAYAAQGVQVRAADYDRPETLPAALAGARRLLLISANEIGRRVPQHQAVISAAKVEGVELLAYTSLLHADSSPLPLAAEHLATEALLREYALPAVLLRNGWYTENYLASVPVALQHGVVLGSAGSGQIASAARADYAEAAAEVLTRADQAGRIYELAGDAAYTLGEFAAEIARLSGKAVNYQDLSPEDYHGALLAAGLPDAIARLLAESDAGAAKGGLFDASHQLSQLIGRPTTAWQAQLQAALQQA